MAVRAHQNAVDLVDEAACERLGINRTDARCLDIIDQRGQITAGQLAQEAHLTTGAVTALLDRMAKRGYVKRVRDKEDRRRVLVRLTPKAQRAAGEVYGPIAEEGNVLLEELSEQELEVMRDFLTRGRDLLVEHASRVRTRSQSPGK